MKDSVSWVKYDNTSHELKVIDGLGSSSVITSASTIVTDGGGYIKPSNGIPASHIASGVIPTESTVSGWGFTKNAAPGKLTTTSTTALSTATNEALSGNISLHKIAKTGTYSDLVGKPDLPMAAYFNPANETMYFFKSTTDRDSFVANRTQTSLAMFSTEVSPYIKFKDSAVEAICVSSWGDGVGITKKQAASVTSMQNKFLENTNIKTFDELKYFTGLTNAYSLADTFRSSSIEKVTLPEDFVITDKNLWRGFRYVSTLKDIDIQNAVRADGSKNSNIYIFDGCSSLTTLRAVNIESLLGILKTAYSLTDTPFGYNTDSHFVYVGGDELRDLVIPSSIVELPASSFYRFNRMTSVVFPNTTTVIGAYSFYECTSLTSATNTDSIITIGQHAFYHCFNLKSISLASVVTIGQNAFYQCSSLSCDLSLPAATTIGNNAFYQCPITSLSLPVVETIGGYAFYQCTGITGDLVLPSSLTSIGNSAFEGCNGLTSLTISENVTTFGTNIVKGCNHLNTLTILSTATVTGQNLSNASFGYGNLLDIYGNFNKNQGSGVYRFKNIKIRGNMIFGAEYGLCDSDLIETFVCKGNYTSERGWLCHTYNNNNPSHLAFVEIMGTITFGSSNGYVLYSSGACACASGCIIHLGYNGVACTSNIARICGNHNNTISRVGKIYVGDGSSQANDQAVLDAYLADSAWQAAPASILNKLDLWYNYTGEYKNL